MVMTTEIIFIALLALVLASPCLPGLAFAEDLFLPGEHPGYVRVLVPVGFITAFFKQVRKSEGGAFHLGGQGLLVYLWSVNRKSIQALNNRGTKTRQNGEI